MNRKPIRIVALKYEPAEGAPQVLLKASGPLADEVLLRRRHASPAAPVVKNEALLDQLYRLPVDAQIGAELFRAVAVLLAHVLRVEADLARTRPGDAHA